MMGQIADVLVVGRLRWYYRMNLEGVHVVVDVKRELRGTRRRAGVSCPQEQGESSSLGKRHRVGHLCLALLPPLISHIDHNILHVVLVVGHDAHRTYHRKAQEEAMA